MQYFKMWLCLSKLFLILEERVGKCGISFNLLCLCFKVYLGSIPEIRENLLDFDNMIQHQAIIFNGMLINFLLKITLINIIMK